MCTATATTTVDDLDEAETFYGDTLGLVTGREPETGTVVVGNGARLLHLQQGPASATCDHVTVVIPAPAFAQAESWQRERVPLLGEDGVEEFEGPARWDSRSSYFLGPAGPVLELIARRRLPVQRLDHFWAEGI